jgi:3',5'-cyclic AMP phosphodiesterase CpdA
METGKKATEDTLILRFRDLVTELGGTIENHRKILGSKDYVWWAWWNKPGEKIPAEEFGNLAHRARESGLELYLFDSGQEYIYSARCSEISYLPGDGKEEIESPEPDATPSYYSKTKYYAWFKFTEISARPLERVELNYWTYKGVDAFFDSGDSRFDAFYGKQVASTAELRQQDRSIWFVRPWKTDDATNEIILLDAMSSKPSNFPSDYRVYENFNILCLSDLHFSTDGHHGFLELSTETSFALWHVIEKALNDHNINNIANVLVSGDLAWKASPDELDQARRSLGELSTKLRLSLRYDFAVCPGNHDLAWSEDPANKDKQVSKVGEEPSAAYSSFYSKLFYVEPDYFLASGRRFILGRSVPIDLAILNSNYLQQQADLFQGHGFLGQKQLDHVAEEMGWNKPQQDGLPIRIVMMHHHVLPVTFREKPEHGRNYSVVLDAEALVRWIVKHRVKVVLHGHMHQPFYAKVGREIPPPSTEPTKFHEFWVLGMGSAGVHADHLGEVGKNTIGVLSFTTKELQYHVYTVHPENPSEHLWTARIPLS